MKSILFSPKLRFALFRISRSFSLEKALDVTKRKKMPNHAPSVAGKKASLPSAAELSYSIAGINKLHTDAAIITPEAIPEIAPPELFPSSLRVKNTQPAPRRVP
jgi:hypothetical protein